MVRSLIVAALVLGTGVTPLWARPLATDLADVKVRQVRVADTTAFIFVEVTNKTREVLHSVQIECSVLDESKALNSPVGAVVENILGSQMRHGRAAVLMQKKTAPASVACHVVNASEERPTLFKLRIGECRLERSAGRLFRAAFVRTAS